VTFNFLCPLTLITWATWKVGRVKNCVFYLSIYRGVTIIYADVMHEHSRKRGDARLKTAMAAFAENSLPDVSERNLMAITLHIHAKSHTVRSRPTLKLVVRSVLGTGWSANFKWEVIYERSFTSEPSIEKYQGKSAHVNTTVYLDRIENPVEYQNVSEEGKETTGICLWVYSLKHTEVLLATSLCEGWKSYKERL